VAVLYQVDDCDDGDKLNAASDTTYAVEFESEGNRSGAKVRAPIRKKILGGRAPLLFPLKV